ncbi:hypothetical protein BDA99DRAFT_533628 [Phascolomyces articulosus]|uniref:Uncharacterized protein n=1 Tax=Phascolomyces articulosus TaxID=60185 RepID=A0AAD5PH67_9FUNG|nr:hypothetical protein BDA99DRAFT_533628 [Phascolomyces articulosus]
MSIPVQAATSMFAPQPVRTHKPPILEFQKQRRRSSSLDKNAYFECFKRHNTPNVISDFLQGWSSASDVPKEEEEEEDTMTNLGEGGGGGGDDNSTIASSTTSMFDRPTHPLPPDRTPSNTATSDYPKKEHHPLHSAEEKDKEQQSFPSGIQPQQQGNIKKQHHRRTQSTVSSADEAEELIMQHYYERQRQDSIQSTGGVSDLLEIEDVKEGVSILRQAIEAMNMFDMESGHDNDQVVETYSTMLKTLCEPNVLRVINQAVHIDIKSNPHAVVDCLIWRMFTKVIEAGYVLQDYRSRVLLAVVQFLMDINQDKYALQALYAMPRPLWDMQAYKLAISLHLMHHPKQIQQAEWLLSEFGKPYLQVANPLAPTLLPPLKIDTPLMNEVTEQDKYKLWMFYQSALNGTEWAKEKEIYEEQRRDSNSKMRNINSSLWKDWALRRLSIETEEERIEHNKIDNDNAMMYTAVTQKQFEYGWGIYVRMGETVDEFTPRVVMHLCWRAFSDTPLMSHVSLRRQWESRAWEVYARFMCSEYMHPDQPEMPGFLCDLILITAFSPDNKDRYTKTLSVYQLLRRLELDSLLRQDQILTPMMCVFLIQCQGSPFTIVDMCQKAFDVWHVKTKLDAKHRLLNQELELVSDQREEEDDSYGPHVMYSLYWALLVMCIKSGSVSDFCQVVQSLLLNSGVGLPTSVVMTIQTFHDRYLCKDTNCYFREYLLHSVQYMDPIVETEEDGGYEIQQDEKGPKEGDNNNYHQQAQRGAGHHDEMDAFGFIRETGKPCSDGYTRNNVVVQPTRRNSMDDVAEPIAYVDHALHQRTNIHEPLATYVAMAASVGACKDEDLPWKPIYSNSNKAKSLIRHCFDVGSNKK